MIEFQMWDVVMLVRAAGIHASVAMTGGNVATIFTYPSDDTNGEFAIISAGPGSYASWDSHAWKGDFYIGPDDNGETEPFSVPAEWTVEQMAQEIIRRHHFLTGVHSVEDLELPWRHEWGTVVGIEYPPNRPLVVDLVFSTGNRTAETRGSRYAWSVDEQLWTYANHPAGVSA